MSKVQYSDDWIRIQDRLPGEQGCDSEEVLVFINGHCAITDMACRAGGAWGMRTGYYDASRGCFYLGGRPADQRVTHWMPKPLPPKPDKLRDRTFYLNLSQEKIDAIIVALQADDAGGDPAPESDLSLAGEIEQAVKWQKEEDQ